MNGELIAPMTYEETMTSDKSIGKVKLISINVLAIVSYYFRFSLLYIIMDKGQAVKKLQLF
ncbi:Spn1, transposase Orf2 [Streptococcus pneumoniae]|nr:Spn1, transposase Orf2 [Streptococcus pneumoniae]